MLPPSRRPPRNWASFPSRTANRRDISEEALLALIDKYNKDPKIHGILVQLPLPKHVNETKVLYAIDPKKDVDGFHPVNVGKLMIGEADYLPCTPAGIQELLVRSGVKTKGAEVVVVGRSNIVGKPIANIMLQKKEGGQFHGDDRSYRNAPGKDDRTLPAGRYPDRGRRCAQVCKSRLGQRRAPR